MKRSLGILLSTGLVISLMAGCSGGTSGESAASDAGSKGDLGSASAQAENDGEYEHLTLVLSLNGTEPADKDMVAEEISKITREKIGAEVELKYISGSAYADQMNLMISSEEDVDLVYTSASANNTTMATNGAFYELNDLLEQYGSGIIDAVGQEVIDACAIDGKIYLIPTVKETAQGAAIGARADIMEELGVAPEDIHTMDDFEELLRKVKEAYPDMIPYLPGGNIESAIGLTVLNGKDRLVDSMGVITDLTGENTKLENIFVSEEYKEFVERMHRWYEEGLIGADVLTQVNEISSLNQAGRLFSSANLQKPDQAKIMTQNAGYEMCVLTFDDVPCISDTNTLMATTYAIPYYAKNPQKSMELLNLMYSDADIANLLGLGIEGTHYVLNDDGTASFANGLTTTTTGYYYYQQIPAIGNEFLVHPWEGNDPDIWEQYEEFNASGIVSCARGFVFDSSPVKTQYAAVKNVFDEFRPSLEYGVADPETVLPEFLEKLEKAGLSDVIKEKQAQFDAWRGAQ